MNLEQRDLDTLAVCSVRYALGRMTYVVDDVASLVERMRPELSRGIVDVICRDIREALERNRAGADIDRKRWAALLATLDALVREQDHLSTTARYTHAGLQAAEDALSAVRGPGPRKRSKRAS